MTNTVQYHKGLYSLPVTFWTNDFSITVINVESETNVWP